MPLKEGATPASFINEFDEYFKGSNKGFQHKTVFLKGTEFEKAVWKSLNKIPFGETRTYKWIAQKIGRPGASRAVGQALSKNPIPIVVPCHRVIGADGSLTGFGGGLPIKQFLLEHEGVLQKQVIAQKTLALT